MVFTDVVELSNVGVVQCRDGSRFPLEPFRELRVRELDRHRAVEPCIACFPYLAHAARADRREKFVGADPSARLHCCLSGHVREMIPAKRYWLRRANSSAQF